MNIAVFRLRNFPKQIKNTFNECEFINSQQQNERETTIEKRNYKTIAYKNIHVPIYCMTIEKYQLEPNKLRCKIVQ